MLASPFLVLFGGNASLVGLGVSLIVGIGIVVGGLIGWGVEKNG